ncbi:ABC transporter ATP-binding protein [Planosporangium thailandense]|uniref:ABC transporter ATP-binding protein n=1 Tax=Planosporangium thailandense TaxID=765197 RepID=A0ABX0XXH9_9ACTN|nr:ABC transporter ATP-binding protein [Planosporangium thailandense]NJC70731.1 ABC transporter ATP-binding protein [Planosporangium thailandense]
MSGRGIRAGEERWLAGGLRPYAGMVALVTAGSAVAALLAVLSSLMTGRALDTALHNGVGGRPLVIVAAVLLSSQVVRAGLIYLRQAQSIRMSTQVERDLRAALIARVLRDAQPQQADGLVANLVSDVRAVRYLIYPGLDLGLSTAAYVAVVLGGAVIWSPQLVLAPLVYAVGYAVVSVRRLRAQSLAARQTRDRSAGLIEQVAEALDNLEAIRDAGGSDAVWQRLSATASAHRDAAVCQGREERRNPLFLLLGIVQGIGFGHALALAHAGQLTVGDMVGYHTLLLLLGAPTFGSGAAFPALANGSAAIGRIRHTLARLAQPDNGTHLPTQEVPTIEVRDAEPAPGRHLPPVLNLSLPPRSLVVVTGPIGSGKSTLLRLLGGIERPVTGSVRIGGVDVHEWRRADLAARVVLVADHDSLFSMCLADNVRLGRWDATAVEVEAAAKRAGVAEFAETMPGRWDARLGTGGNALSGGQRQRIALARALLSDNGVLLLDDPFSALDSGMARYLASELIAVARERTVIVVSDRADLRAAATHVLHLNDQELTVIDATGGG